MNISVKEIYLRNYKKLKVNMIVSKKIKKKFFKKWVFKNCQKYKVL